MNRTDRTNVTDLPTPLVGREADLDALARDFEGSTRLVTLLGPGGVGKTTLARRFAHDRAEAYAAHGGGGAWLVDLTHARTTVDACSAVAAALELTLSPGRQDGPVVAGLGEQLARRQRLLLVLDNCEHLVAEVGAVVSEWQKVAPRASLLVTSRVALGVEGEQIRPVLGLHGDEGGELFLRCARRAHPDLSPTEADRAAIEEIVRRVDGFPLAIELAAARTRVLSAAQVRDRLALGLLERPGDDSRHGSMRGAILESVRSLSPDLAQAFTACAVFHGGFGVEAAEAVLGDGQTAPLTALTALADHSLLHTTSASAGDRRFALFETIREVALERLTQTPGTEAIAARHARYYAQLGETLAARFSLRGQPAAMDELALERDNLLAAHAHAVRQQDAELATRLALALDPLLATRGPHRMRLRLLEETVQAGASFARVRVARGQAHRELGDLEAARADLERGRAIAVERDEETPAALADLRIGELIEVAGATQQARERYVGAIARLGDERDPERRLLAADGHALLGHAHRREGALDEAEEHFAQAERRYRAIGRREGLGAMAYERAVVALFRRDHELAAQRLAEGLDHAHATGARQLAGAIYSGLGVLAQERGVLEEAITRHTEAVRVFRELGNQHREGSALYYLAGTYLESGALRETHAVLDRAARVIEAVGASRYIALIEGLRAAAHATEDKRADAFVALSRADEVARDCRSERSLLATLAIHRLHLADLDARERLAEGRALARDAPGDDPRFALRVLEGRGRAPTAAWVLRPEGRGFRAPGADGDVDLSHRRPLSRILHALGRRRLESPGEPLGLDDLLTAGWPDERMTHASANNRLHVALSALRKLGLREVLLSREGGYLLDPSVTFRVE